MVKVVKAGNNYCPCTLLQDTSSLHLTDCIKEFTREEVLDGDEKPVSNFTIDDPYLLFKKKFNLPCRYVQVVVKLSSPLNA